MTSIFDRIKLCDFCRKEVPPAPLNELTVHGMDVYFCLNCSAEYVYMEKGIGLPVSVHQYIKINDKMYRWSVSNIDGKAHLWYVKSPGVPGIRPNRDMHHLITFKHYPRITPENIEAKIRMMLIFL